MDGCYDARAAPGSGVCREARDGACVGYKEEDKTDKASAGIIRAGVEETPTCEEASSSSEEQGKCAQNKCDVTIGGNEYCSQCSTAAEYLIDGACTTQIGTSGCQVKSDSADGTCASCTGANYFLHSGGCYSTAEDKPGRTLCTAASGGVCTTAATGYFAIPNAPNTGESVVKCDDTTGIQINTDKYLGTADCEVCRPSATPAGARTDSVAVCTKCGSNKYLKSDGSGCVESSGCTSDTEFPKEDTNNGNRCVSCGDQTDGIADCQECSKSGETVTCSACTLDTKKPNADGTKCFACPNSGTTASCDRCSADGVCEACASGKVLTPTLLCLDDCGGLPGYYADTASKRCAKCSEGCKECTGTATQCTACPAGKRLAYTNSADYGTCVEECAASTGSASGSCRTCGASIGGTKYCSGCSVGAEIPVNGVCQTNPSRAAICAEPDNAGGCNKCATGYFLLEKGCYEAAKQPGVQVCKTADGGLCTTCASGLAASGGDCSA
ncbi:Variant-specific surface protein [Giardia duodenalis]|uniref:Variant-specific surface protein n=1 Tax=Giardia intestinalis TaxID=5741 RepID=V6TT50_GIAIN|nr:Variant-specific surface protein [Giardia intestinalis]